MANSTGDSIQANIASQVAAFNKMQAQLKQIEGTQDGDILLERLNDQVNKVAWVIGEANTFLGN